MSTALARIPAGPIDPTPDEFRIAMRNLAAGVSVVATGYGKARAGLTVTSVSSLSIDPPCLLVCIGRSSGTLAALRANQAFGVSVLAENQQSIADRFAGRGGVRGAARFAGSHWITGITGAPLAVGALSARVKRLCLRSSTRLDRSCPAGTSAWNGGTAPKGRCPTPISPIRPAANRPLSSAPKDAVRYRCAAPMHCASSSTRIRSPAPDGDDPPTMRARGLPGHVGGALCGHRKHAHPGPAQR